MAHRSNFGRSLSVIAVEWCDRLPDPVPDSLIPIGIITASTRCFWEPVSNPEGEATWARRIRNAIDRGRRSGDCVVVADLHF